MSRSLVTGAVLLVAVIGAVWLFTLPWATIPLAVPVVGAAPRAAQPTVVPTAAPAIGNWTLRGSGNTDDFQIAEGNYRLVWTMDVVAPMLDPAGFDVTLMAWPDRATPQGLVGLVDFTQPGPTAKIGTFGDTVPVGPTTAGLRSDPTPAGHYYLRVLTCDYCRWSMSLWPR